MRKRKMFLFQNFVHSFALINRRIAQYALMSLNLEMIQKQSPYQINNIEYFDNPDEERNIILGAYEVDRCVEFAKAIRKEFFFHYMKNKGKFSIVLDADSTTDLLEYLLNFMLSECGFTSSREIVFDKILYVASKS